LIIAKDFTQNPLPQWNQLSMVLIKPV
jgi:hypothetical protein